MWVPGSRYTTSAILLIDAIAGVGAFLRRTNLHPRRAWRATVVLLLVIGLGIGWSTSFRYPNLRSGNASLSRTHADVGAARDVASSAVDS